MEIQKIRVNTDVGYDVHIGKGLLSKCGEIASAVINPCRAAIVTDSNVAELYLDEVKASLEKSGYVISTYIFPAGESSKNMAVLSDILEFFASIPLTRTDCVFALGGGVTGDMTGFAAGCYLRGIRFVQIPTTLLAAVDSSVGGKTAVDLAAGKNLAGLFIEPQAVIFDTDCIGTLGESELADGYAEALKTGILSDEELFSLVENRGDITDIVSKCVKYKAWVVTEDMYEGGLRKCLNLGHTVAHAIEKLSGYTVSHGHAVAAGLAVITRYAAKNGLCSIETAKRIVTALENNNLPTTTEYSAEELAEVAFSDKKRSGNSITLVIPTDIGSFSFKTLPTSDIKKIIKSGLEDIK